MHVMRAERLSVLQDEVGELLRVLSRFRWQLGFERLLRFGLRGLMGSALAAVGLSLATWLIAGSDSLFASYTWLVTLPLAATVVLAVLRWPSEREAALLADQRLVLDERLGTAVELASRLRAQAPSQRFDRLQIRDAIEHATAAPGGWPGLDARVRREAVWALGLILLAAPSLLLPNLPRPRLPGQSQAPSSVDAGPADLQQRALPFDAVDPTVADVPPVPPPAQPGPNLATHVQQAQAERVALDALSQALGSVSAAQPAGDAIQQSDFSSAQQQLSNLGDQADQLSGAAKQQLATALQQAANSTNTADRPLADRERQAAQALSRSNYADQRQALRNLGDQVARSGAQSVPADQLARDVGQLQQQSGSQGSGGQGTGGQGSGATGQGVGADGNAAAGQQPGGQGAGSGGQQGGAGIGTGAGGDPLGDTPSRLESSGQSVAVPLMLGNGSGVRPPDGSEDQTGSDPSTGAGGVAEQAQTQPTGQVAPEQNLVPSEQRPVVRGYFQ